MPTDLDQLSTAWLAAARRGDFASAWTIADRVLAHHVKAGPCWDRPRHCQWIWDGRPFRGRRLLVRCYHGLGDTIQFARFLPVLGTLASEVTVWAQPVLLPLLASLPGERRLLPLHDGTPEVDYDVDIELMEIPYALRLTLETIPRQVPYLCVWSARGRRAEQFSVGLVARAGDWDARRSVPNHLLAAIARVPGVAAFNLQIDQPIPGTIDLSHPDPLTLARRLLTLDLVITVDTMVAHLAGALAVPVWTLLPTEADWRWMDDRLDSPWYRTMRLFRQRRNGAWPSVLQDVIAELQRTIPAVA